MKAIKGKCILCAQVEFFKSYIYKNECYSYCPLHTTRSFKEDFKDLCEVCNGLIYHSSCYNECPTGTLTDYYNFKCIEIETECTFYLYDGFCYEECPVGTKTNFATRTCTLCSSLNLIYFEGNCHQRCPDGYESISFFCESCLSKNKLYEDEKCVDYCSNGNVPINNICSPFTGFYLNGNKLNECPDNYGYDITTRVCYEKQNNLIIDDGFPIDMKYNPIANMIDDMNEFVYKSNREKENIIQETKFLLDTSIKFQEIDNETLLKKSIVLLQMINVTNSDEDLKKINDDIIEIINSILDCSSLNTLLTSTDSLLTGAMALYYSLLNQEYMTESTLTAIHKITLCIIEDSPELIDNIMMFSEKIKKDTEKDFVNIITKTVGKISNELNVHLKDIKIDDFDETRFNSDIPYKLNYSIVITEIGLKIKNTIEKNALMSIQLNQNSQITNQIFNITNSDIISHLNCNNDNSKIISEMKQKNLKIKLCLPDKIVKQYKQISNVGMIEYSSYPLLNENITNDISPQFISLKMYDKYSNEINITQLEKPIRIFIQKPFTSFNECVFYDENSNKINSTECNSKVIDDYVLCSCTHLTDFTLSRYNPINIVKDVVNLFKQVRIINSFEPFKHINKENAIVIYVFSGIFVVYLILLVVMIILDKKSKSDFFIIMVDKEEKCCSKESIEEEIEELKLTTEKELLWKSILGKQFKENTEKDRENRVILKNLGLTLNEEKISKTKKDNIMIEMKEFSKENKANPQKKKSIFKKIIEKHKKEKEDKNKVLLHNEEHFSSTPKTKPKTQNEISNKKNKQTSHKKEIFLSLWYVNREFYLNEYRIIALIMNRQGIMSRTNYLTLIFIRLIAALSVCSLLSVCNSKSNSENGFTNRDLAVSIGTILIIEIPFTFIEILLCKTKLPKSKQKEKDHKRKWALFVHIIIYIFFTLFFACGFINTTWIYLDADINERHCDFIKDFVISTLLDYFVYEIVIISMKSIIYTFLITTNKSSYVKACLVSFIAALPWLFAIGG